MQRIHTYRHGSECPLCLAEAKMARIDDPDEWRSVGEYRAFMVISAAVMVAAVVMVALTRIGGL